MRDQLVKYREWVDLRDRALGIMGPGARGQFGKLYSFESVMSGGDPSPEECISIQRGVLLAMDGGGVALMAAMLEGEA